MYNTTYDSKYGTGDRRRLIEQVYVKGLFSSNSPLDRLIDGDYNTKNSYFLGGSTSSKEIVFRMKENVIINEFAWYQSSNSSHGKWEFIRLSPKGEEFKLGEFTLGGSEKQIVKLKDNIGPSSVYILRGVSGSASSGPYIYQIDFKAKQYARILVQLNGKYGYFKDGEFIPLEEQREPTYEDYQNFGMSNYREFKKEEWKESGDKLSRTSWSEEEDGECFSGNINLLLPENKRVNILGIGRPFITEPGPQDIIAGNEEAGFFGEVDSDDFICPEDLSNMLGVTQGTLQMKCETWFKFSFKNKILFKTRYSLRYGISMNHLISKNVVNGSRKIEIGEHTYKVRLIKGLSDDDNSVLSLTQKQREVSSYESEWNRLIVPLQKDRSGSHSNYTQPDLEKWDLYSKDDMHRNYGRMQWTMDKWSNSGDRYLLRGCNNYDISCFLDRKANETGSGVGWSPVLELIQD